MAGKRQPSLPRRMKRMALIVCEGETEAAYIHLLRLWFKSSIKIKCYIAGTRISQMLLERQVKELKISQGDHIELFLMYDMDVPAINAKIEKCRATKLLSNPCFELWLLLHKKDQRSSIDSEALIRKLKESGLVWTNYVKSNFTETQKDFLLTHMDSAVMRARVLPEFENPSTGIYKLIEILRNMTSMEKA